jgi:predicted anti-sigma-YlaC factor YlaD
MDSCLDARVLISAAADDELRGDELRALELHLEGCPECQARADAVAKLTRSIRLRSAALEGEFVRRVVSRSRPARLGRGGWLRPALAWLGIVIAIESTRPLVFGEIDGTPTHIARHLGASGLALAIGMIYAAWRPHRAFGLLPLVTALLATTLLSTLLDTVDGDRSVLSEAYHVLELAGLVVLWMVAGSPGWERMRDGMRSLRRRGGVARPTS